jgi:hypothetical protein
MTHQRILVFIAMFALCATHLAHAGTIAFEVTPVSGGSPGEPIFQYTYFLTDVDFVAQEELDIVFAANEFGTLSDGVVSPGFELNLFQPNNPPGTTGDFSALALSNLGAVSATWSVDVVYLGSGEPGPVPYFLNLYDANGDFLETLQSGETVPEPATFVLVGLAVVGSYIWRSRSVARPRRISPRA